jgi:hypothetical protein
MRAMRELCRTLDHEPTTLAVDAICAGMFDLPGE